VTDRQTDRQTDGKTDTCVKAIAISALHSMLTRDRETRSTVI